MFVANPNFSTGFNLQSIAKATLDVAFDFDISSFIESKGVIMSPDIAASSFQAMGSDARLSVLRALIRAGDTGLNVGDIQHRTGIPASTLSHHIRVLADAGVIEQHRQGRATMTRAAFDHLRDLADFILSECCNDAPEGAAQKHHEMA